nr:MAG TPA: hypothetical protein [Caudoviricetes sp.]
MVREVKTLRRKVAEALNESKLPPVVAQLVLDSIRTELQSIVQMQEAAEAVAPPEEKEAEDDGSLQGK